MNPDRAVSALTAMMACSQPPATVYQTVLDEKSCQDTKTPLRLCLQLSSAVAAHLAGLRHTDPSLESGITAVIRRFDLRELEVAVGDAGNQRMLGLRVCPKLFTYSLAPGGQRLFVDVHRKELPVSKTFAGASFVFVFHFPSSGELVVTQPFQVSSKEPRGKDTKAKKAPKRVRGPAPRHPVASDADERERAVNEALAALLGHTAASVSVTTASTSSMPPVLSSAVVTAAAAAAPVSHVDSPGWAVAEEPEDDAPVPLKRSRLTDTMLMSESLLTPYLGADTAADMPDVLHLDAATPGSTGSAVNGDLVLDNDFEFLDLFDPLSDDSLVYLPVEDTSF